MKTEQLYEARHVQQIIGISGPCWDQWLYKGMIRPTKKSTRIGRRNKIDSQEILRLKILSYFMDEGFTSKKQLDGSGAHRSNCQSHTKD